MDNRNHIDASRTTAGRNTIKQLGSPKEIQRRNLLIVLAWIHKWGFSTAEILSDLLGRANRSHARRMEKDGWIRSVSITGYPTYYVLTEKGQAEAIRHSSVLLEYKESDPYRVSLPKLHHDLVTQKETITAITQGGYRSFITQRMFDFDKNCKPLKIPDVILIDCVDGEFEKEVDELTGVEIELTPKWNHDLDMFVTNIIDDIQLGRLVKFLIISDSRAIRDNYEKAFQPGRQVPRWDKASGIQFKKTGETLEIPSWVPSRVFFREVGDAKLSYPTSYLP